MADKKISELTALTAAATDDYFPVLDTDAVTTKKISLTNLATGVRIANKLIPLSALADDNATSVTPANASGFLFIRKLSGATGAVIAYDVLSPTAYCFVIAATSDVVATTGVLAGTTGTDAKLTVSAHTDGKIYIENRLGSTAYIGYIAI